MTHAEEKPQAPIVIGDECGSVTTQRLRCGVVLQTSMGHLRTALAEQVIAVTHRELIAARNQGRKLLLIKDCWELRRVETAYRERYAKWLRSHSSDIQAVLVLHQSKLIVMAASIVSLTVGPGLMRMFNSVVAFERAIAEMAPGLDWHRPAGLRRAS